MSEMDKNPHTGLNIQEHNENEDHNEHVHKPDPMFLGTIAIFTIAIITFYSVAVDYHSKSEDGKDGKDTVAKKYPMFQDVHIMIFIGFAFLMTFLRKHAFNSLGNTFMIGAFSILMGNVINTIFHEGWLGHDIEIKKMNVENLIKGDFAAGAVLISYGAVRTCHFYTNFMDA